MCPISETENAADDSNHLKEFIAQSRARLKAVLGKLQWTEEDIFANYNTNAQSLETTSGQEEDVSELDTEPPLPESCATKNTVILVPSELRKLVNNAAAQIPQKFSDLQVNFTRDQKLQLYEYVIEHTEKSTEPDLTDTVLNDGQLSFAEIVAQKKREGKNRRRHRTTKPTHIEEVRGLVDLQMQALQQYLETKEREERIRKRKMESKRSRSREGRRDVGYTSHHRDKYRKRSRSKDRRRSKGRSHSRSRREHKKHKRSRSRSRRRDKSPRYKDDRSSRRSHETSRSSNKKYENSKTHHRSSKDSKRYRSPSSKRHKSKHNSVEDRRR